MGKLSADLLSKSSDQLLVVVEPSVGAKIDVARELQRQNELGELASSLAHMRGIHGMVTDESVRSAITTIQAMPKAERYDAFEMLYIIVVNGHERGCTADVLTEVSWAQTEDMYEEVSDVE